MSEAGSSEQQSAESDTEERRVKRLGDASAEDWEPALNAPALPGGNPEQFDPYELPDPAQNAYLESLLSRLAARPGNQEALTELEALLDSVLDQANEQGDLENQAAMRRLLGVVQNVNPRKAGLSDAYQRLDALTQINTWIAKANAAFERGDLVQPAADNAHEWTRKVLRTSPENPEAQSLKRAIHEQLIERALLSAGELDFEKAQAWLEEASEIGDDQELVEQALIKIALIKQAEADQIEAQILEAIESGNFDLAEFVLIDLIALTGHTSLVTELREELRVARVYGQYEPGQVIQDPFINAPGSAPAVVVIQPGSFLMGSVSSEQGRSENEGPQHRVTFSRGFAMGLQEVTVGQFRSFIEATRHRTYADEAGRSRVYDEKTGRISERTGINWAYDYEGNRAAENAPVLHVTWHDAKAFVAWLSLETGKVYRLPSEAEYEYVMRAGTVTRYWWGDGRPEIAVENLTGAEDTSPSGRVWTTAFRRYGDGFWGPAPGASFPPNPWGLHDMAGNVSEWVEDCWHDTYALAPEDGSAWINPGCTRKVIRGGYWASAPDQSRSAARLSGGESLSGPRVGFRVARDL
ncbi:MAG: SUMF1/EgtB/PvdO family nonheme iron enzyme [Xanthomonadales bacterium]|nr:SUMF1/EgtB/PvdO family nonheme iron enzyme [Xanthomonadales bacterium]